MPPSRKKAAAPEKGVETPQHAAKFRMRPSWDIINRIQHDPSISSDDIMIGYVDFGDVVEKKFSAFSHWGKLEMASLHDLSIPQHRIKYFKHEPTGTVLWDKDHRVDFIIGSAPPFETLDLSTLEDSTNTSAIRSQKKLNPDNTPLQRFLNHQGISDFNFIKKVLTGSGEKAILSYVTSLLPTSPRFLTARRRLRMQGKENEQPVSGHVRRPTLLHFTSVTVTAIPELRLP